MRSSHRHENLEALGKQYLTDGYMFFTYSLRSAKLRAESLFIHAEFTHRTISGIPPSADSSQVSTSSVPSLSLSPSLAELFPLQDHTPPDLEQNIPRVK